MTTYLTANPRELMGEHGAALREYASRVIVRGEVLTPREEEEDKAARIREYLALGTSFGCTQKELVLLLYKGLLRFRRGCGCPSCRSRQGAGEPQPS